MGRPFCSQSLDESRGMLKSIKLQSIKLYGCNIKVIKQSIDCLMDYCCYLLLNPRDPIDATRCKIFLDGDWGYNILREVQLIKIDRTVDSTFMLVESIKVTLMDCFFGHETDCQSWIFDHQTVSSTCLKERCKKDTIWLFN